MVRLLVWACRKEAKALVVTAVSSCAVFALLYLVAKTNKILPTVYIMVSGMLVLMNHAGYRMWNRDVRIRLLPVSARSAAVTRIVVGWSFLVCASVVHVGVAIFAGRDPEVVVLNSAAVLALHAAALAFAYILSDTSPLWGGKKGIIAPFVVMGLVYLPVIGGVIAKGYHVLVPLMTTNPVLFLSFVSLALLLAAAGVQTHIYYEVWIGPPPTLFTPTSVQIKRRADSPVWYLLRTHLRSYRWAYLLTAVVHIGLYLLLSRKTGLDWDFTSMKTMARVVAMIVATAIAGSVFQAILDGEEPNRCQYALLPIAPRKLGIYRSILMGNIWLPYVAFWIAWGVVRSSISFALAVLAAAFAMWILQSLFVLLLDIGVRSPSPRFEAIFNVWSPGVGVIPHVVAAFLVTGSMRALWPFGHDLIPVTLVALILVVLLSITTVRSYANRRSYVM